MFFVAVAEGASHAVKLLDTAIDRLGPTVLRMTVFSYFRSCVCNAEDFDFFEDMDD